MSIVSKHGIRATAVIKTSYLSYSVSHEILTIMQHSQIYVAEEGTALKKIM